MAPEIEREDSMRAVAAWTRAPFRRCDDTPLGRQHSSYSYSNSYRNSLLKTEKQDRKKVSFATNHGLITIRVNRLKHEHFSGRNSKQFSCRQFGSTAYASPRFGGCDDNFVNIEPGNWVIENAAGSNKHIAVLQYLANLSYGGWPAVYFKCASTVRADDNVVRSADSHYGSCYTEVTEQERRNYAKNPRYLRFRSLGFSTWWREEENDSTIFDLLDRDIDVSGDGRKWFHLLGAECLGHLPSWHSKPRLTVRQSTTHDPSAPLP